MPKRSSKKASAIPEEPLVAVPTPDQGEIAELSGAPPEGKNPAAVALGRLGGKKGGLARAKKLTKEQRSEIAKKAARARWTNRQDQ